MQPVKQNDIEHACYYFAKVDFWRKRSIQVIGGGLLARSVGNHKVEWLQGVKRESSHFQAFRKVVKMRCEISRVPLQLRSFVSMQKLSTAISHA